MALRITAALVVLPIFAGLAYLVSTERIDGSALLPYAGAVLGHILNAGWSKPKGVCYCTKRAILTRTRPIREPRDSTEQVSR